MKLTTKNIMGEIERLYDSRPSTDVEACIIMNDVTKKILICHYNDINNVTISDIDRVFGMLIFVQPIKDDNMVIMPLRNYTPKKPTPPPLRYVDEEYNEVCGKCVIMGGAKVCECHEDHEGRERNAIVRRIDALDKQLSQTRWFVFFLFVAYIVHLAFHYL